MIPLRYTQRYHLADILLIYDSLTYLALVQERSREQAARGDIAGTDHLGVSAGALCTEPFELNHALIALIIGQQRLRASCAPSQHDHPEARLRDVGRPVAAASQSAPPPRSAALHSAAHCVVDSPNLRSPVYVPCTSLRAQADAPCPPSYGTGGTHIQRLAVLEASLDSSTAMSEGADTFNATHSHEQHTVCSYAC